MKMLISIFALSVILLSSFGKADVVIQDVLWTKDFEDTIGETYFGQCRFSPSPCRNDPYSNLASGVCLQEGRCEERGGVRSGTCSNGFGECCTFRKQCQNGTQQINVDELVTVFSSSAPYPESSGSCSIRLHKEPDICQVRLDFERFTSNDANKTGDCLSDNLKIFGSANVQDGFTTCGRLEGQHLYLAYGPQNYIEVSVTLENPNSNYQIIATKIPCNSKHRVPDHCTQYYFGINGNVSSLGYGFYEYMDHQGQQQNTQRYTVCVEPISHSSQIEWKPCRSGYNSYNYSSFSISSSFPHGVSYGSACKTDWVQFKGSERICGETDNFLQKSNWKPYEMMVNFDDKEFPDPPVGFPIIPPDACPANPAMCTGASNGFYDCMCGGENGNMCQCTAKPGVPSPEVPMPDINNRGFCLEYNQV